jgi:hypothetical protein
LTRKKLLRVAAAALIVLAGVGLVGALYSVALTDKSAAERDFISYWSAGQLLRHGQNPYDFVAVHSLELKAGRDPKELLLMMRNPPTAFFLAYPMGFAGPKTSLIAWMGVLLGTLSLAILFIGKTFGTPNDRWQLLGYIFAPAYACLMAGQFGIVMLLGVTLFLYLHRTRPFLAGMAFALCALKPHYFLPFGLVLVLWSANRKSVRILAGFFTMVAAICAVAWALDPHAWTQYSQMMKAGGALNEVLPILSAQLRLLIDPQAAWIQFVPEVGACIWASWYFWSRRSSWNWNDHGLLVLLVGALCTPFGWFFDESVLLPAVVAGIYRAIERRRPVWPVGVICGAALLEILAGPEVISRYFLWTTPAWLGWYLYATWGGAQSASAAISAN